MIMSENGIGDNKYKGGLKFVTGKTWDPREKTCPYLISSPTSAHGVTETPTWDPSDGGPPF